MKRTRSVFAAGAFALGLVAGVARADSIHLYSYDPANDETRRAAGPLTFTFKKGLLRNTLLNVRSTEAPATADLRRVDEGALGRGGLREAIGAAATERDLYEVEPADQGEALISALCPGAKRAWMVFGWIKLNRDLDVVVVGAPAEGGPAKLCRTLRFTFHGEWLLPPGRPIDPRDAQPPPRYRGGG